MAHTHGEPPNAIVDWPAVGLSFANPDDSGLGGGGQGNVQTIDLPQSFPTFKKSLE